MYRIYLTRLTDGSFSARIRILSDAKKNYYRWSQHREALADHVRTRLRSFGNVSRTDWVNAGDLVLYYCRLAERNNASGSIVQFDVAGFEPSHDV